MEYYNASGSPGRMRKKDNRKIRNGWKEIETDIPTAKTANVEQFTHHIQYIFTNPDAFFNFYDFTVAEITWKNYRGRQKALDVCSNILNNGSEKYNKNRRKKKKTRLNRSKRKRILNRRNPGIEHQPLEPSHIHCCEFQLSNTNKMPLVIFGDGLTNKSSVQFWGLRNGVSEKIYKHLLKRNWANCVF
ncbi:hypothetical protein RMATCC62417_10930 [Rhizopus microsporus]|nr:hypothetical protein RMATCC62417_10930 [Rhizopus microsporus]